VRHIVFRTTVLAQDDSGVGVKNAVNLFGLKNLIGTFAPPWAINQRQRIASTCCRRARSEQAWPKP